jgi:Flp pilus assembly protein TadD
MKPTPQHAVQTALKHLQKGDLAGAEAICRKLLITFPREPELLNLLGVILGQKGETHDSISMLSQAISIRPQQPSFYTNLGVSLLRSKQFESAEHQFRKALEIDGASARPRILLAQTLQAAGRIEDALHCAIDATRLAPQDASARYTLATIYEEAGDAKSAEMEYRRALQLNPAFAEAHNNLGAILRTQGRAQEAVVALKNAILYQPGLVTAYANLGAVLQDINDLSGAIEILRKGLKLSPQSAQTQSNLGLALLRSGQHSEAERHLRIAIELNPDLVEAHNNLGKCFHEMGESEKAVECFNRALQIRPDLAQALSGLGFVHFDRGEYEVARQFYVKALAANPASENLHFDLGSIMGVLNHPDEEIALYRSALALNPALAKAHKNLAYSFLKKGNWGDAWQEFGWRSSTAHHPRGPRRGNGELPGVDIGSLSGRVVVIHSEQGLGDIIFFMRFAPLLKRAGARLAYCGEPRLAQIFQRTGLFESCLDLSCDLPSDSVQLLVGDLPYICGCGSPELAPRPLALNVDPLKQEKMRSLLAHFGSPPYLGLTWRAGSEREKEQYRSLFKTVPLQDLALALRDVEARIVSLQRSPKEGEHKGLVNLLGRPVLDLSTVNDDMDEMLALLSCLDEYVGVSNTNMHLRAGIGKTARVLVPVPTEWRWMASGASSPWFPGFEIYRQDLEAGWSPALKRLSRDLRPA